MPHDPTVTAFWDAYLAYTKNCASSLGPDFIPLNHKEGQGRPRGSLSLYFYPWAVGQPYFGYQTNMGRAVLYLRSEDQKKAFNKYLETNPQALQGEKFVFDGLNFYIPLKPINIDEHNFEYWRDTAVLSYEKIVKLYKLANKVFPGLPRR